MTITKKTVQKITSSLLNEHPVFIQKLNNGVTNKVYKVILKSGSYLIVRVSSSPTKLNDFIKEQWCCNQAKSIGIKVPEILEVGNSIVPFPYMVATETYGIPGNMYDGNCYDMFYEMGVSARKIHKIKTHGYGDIFDWSSNILSKNNTWQDFLKTELSIDEIIAFYEKQSILTPANLKKIKRISKQIRSLDFQPSLSHSDLLPKNVIVDKEGKLISIIDWEGAISSNAEIWDLAVTLNNISEEEQKIFLKGYGLSLKAFAEIEPMIRGFYVLRKHDMVEVHVLKKEAKLLASLQTRFNKMLDAVAI